MTRRRRGDNGKNAKGDGKTPKRAPDIDKDKAAKAEALHKQAEKAQASKKKKDWDEFWKLVLDMLNADELKEPTRSGDEIHIEPKIGSKHIAIPVKKDKGKKADEALKKINELRQQKKKVSKAGLDELRKHLVESEG